MSKVKLVVLGLLVVGGLFSYKLTNNRSKLVPVTSTFTEVTQQRSVTNTTGELTVKATNIEVGNDTVRLETVVTQQSVAVTINALEDIRKSGANKAYLLINSPGGDVFAGLRLVNYMKASSMPVYTICNGLCASMAAHIHQAGTKRLMTPTSILMFHPASGGTQGTIEQMTNRIKIIKQVVDELDGYIAKRSGVDYKEFKTELATELWVETPEALQRHFADGLVNLIGKEPVPEGSILEKSSYDYYLIEMH